MTVVFTRVFKPPTRSYFLLGPRGTGKTHWLREHYGTKAQVFDLLNPSLFLHLQRDPRAFQEEVAALPANAIIVIDEVQKLPNLLDIVHHYLATPGNRRRFVLTGSSARKLRKGGANLLAGRASVRQFFPLNATEHLIFQGVQGQKRITALDRILRFGTLPEVLGFGTDAEAIEFLDAYTLTYLREEIQQEAAAKSLDSFSRFLRVAALSNGQLVNTSSMARDAGVARTTVNGYFDALDDTLVGRWLRPWRTRIRIKEVGHSKFYFFDPGVARAAAGTLRQPLDNVERGHLLECYFFHELNCWNAYQNIGAEISFWGARSGGEIDFVVQTNTLRIGIEVKASERWRPEMGKVLKSLHAEGHFDRIIGVYLGDRPRKSEALDILPLWNFFDLLQGDALIRQAPYCE